jgi:phosphate uptake regulator
MPVFESSRKVLVSGSSLAMTLPSLFVKASEIEKGAVVNVLYGLDGVLVMSQREDRQTIEGLVKILERLEEKVNSEGIDLEDEAP